MQQNIVSY